MGRLIHGHVPTIAFTPFSLQSEKKSRSGKPRTMTLREAGNGKFKKHLNPHVFYYWVKKGFIRRQGGDVGSLLKSFVQHTFIGRTCGSGAAQGCVLTGSWLSTGTWDRENKGCKCARGTQKMVGAERTGAVAQEVVWTAGEGGRVRGTPVVGDP